ncbi:MAG: alpha-galactosidase [Clostridia bacterium]
MKASGFELYLRKDGIVKKYKDSAPGVFGFSLNERSENGITVLSGEITAEENIEPVWVETAIAMELNGLGFYANGFQSWSESPYCDEGTGIRKLNVLLREGFRLKYYGDYHFSKRLWGLAYSHLYLDLQREGKTEVFIGDLMPGDSYTMFYPDYDHNTVVAASDIEGLKISAGESRELFRISISGDGGMYFALLGQKPLTADKITGWTSWYNYYTKITEYILESNMHALRESKIPIDVFQIDDGWFHALGDWLECNDKFPGGMQSVAKKIKAEGWKAGLWLAPFICDRESIVYQEHNGWIQRDKRGRLQPAGWNPNWNGIFYAMDIYNEGFREYLAEVFDAVAGEWGYDFMKLDFLYAAAIQPREGKTRCMVMCDAMDMILGMSPGSKILACGAPIGPSMGRCHYCRIGADVANIWEDRFLKAINYRERVSTASSISNTISRSFLNGKAFMNDPDVFFLRDTKEIRLTNEQKELLFKTNIENSGLVFFSDDVSQYSPEQTDRLKKTFSDYRV